jgi:hypothetical protein
MTRWFRRLCLASTLALTLGLTASPALAQNPGEPPPAGDSESGRPLDGYLATGALAFAALFAVAKTARR